MKQQAQLLPVKQQNNVNDNYHLKIQSDFSLFPHLLIKALPKHPNGYVKIQQEKIRSYIEISSQSEEKFDEVNNDQNESINEEVKDQQGQIVQQSESDYSVEVRQKRRIEMEQNSYSVAKSVKRNKRSCIANKREKERLSQSIVNNTKNLEKKKRVNKKKKVSSKKAKRVAKKLIQTQEKGIQVEPIQVDEHILPQKNMFLNICQLI